MRIKNDMSLHTLSEVKQVSPLGRNSKSVLEIEKKMKIPLSFLKPMMAESLPEGSNISLIGPPGVGKTIFCENLTKDFVKNDVSCIYVTLDKAPDDVRNDFHEIGCDVSKEGSKRRIIFVDGFSWLIGKSDEDYHIGNLGNLTELSIQIASATCDLAGPTLLIFDSVSPLSVYNPEDVVIKFLQLLFARIKDWKGVGVYVVQEGVHSTEFYNILGYLVDGILDMKMEESNEEITRYLRIRSLKSMAHQTRWMPFVIQAHRNLKVKYR